MKKTTFLQITFLLSALTFTNLSFSQDIVVSEINYHADSTRDAGSWIELYNRGSAAIDITNWVFSDDDASHFFIIPSKVMNPGDYAVLTQDQAQFNVYYPGLPNVLPGSFVFGLSNKTDEIRLYDATNNLQFYMEYADSVDWPKTPDGHGRTLEVRNIFGNYSDQYNWFAGCMMGSPGGPHIPCYEPIIFSEINYHSSATFDVGDWVELRNTTSSNMDLSGWVFKDKNDSNAFVIPSGFVIPPGENRVLASDLSKFNAEFSQVKAIGSYPFSFNNSKDILRLYNNAGVIAYSLQYEDVYPWPVDADGGGYTLEIIDQTGIVNDGNNWKIGCLGGSPGTYYNTSCLVGLAEKSAIVSNSSVFPNPFSKEANLVIHSENTMQNFSVELYNVLGKKVGVLDNKTARVTNNKLTYIIEASTYGPGIYFYRIIAENKLFGGGKLIIID